MNQEPPIDRRSLHFRAIHYRGQSPGPRFLVTGAVHGNETCGTQAITQIMADIDRGALGILAGEVTFIPVVNPLAYARRQRAGDRNLNRNLAPTDTPSEFEDHIAQWLCPLMARHDVLLDLHSTRAHNPAFAMLGPQNNEGALQPFRHAAAERALARHLGVARFVDGWLGTYAIGVQRRVARGTGGAFNRHPRYGVGTTEYMRSVGGYAITLECGQHDDPQSPKVGYAAIRNALAFLGISGHPPPQPVTSPEVLHMVDVIDRDHPGDQFVRAWSSFEPLRQGDVIGTRHAGGVVTAPHDGYILFPDAQAEPGHEWFYLTQTGTL
jgi:predicted deacylase